MAHGQRLRGQRVNIPHDIRAAFADGEERHALTLLLRERDLYPAGSRAWAELERLSGLVMIHMLREVEGTFALERADTLLDALPDGTPPVRREERPTLAWLETEGEG
ncbi:hypothetical protein [Deinococcus aquatilis]|jgi:hypothetical protein|uniref:hypothetical protein n=1 Tax=Deinococcus aquatilis TaxID=519440 RepID=UPI000381DC88|nr:hypothetical protein [Deinococcus aquatilis]